MIVYGKSEPPKDLTSCPFCGGSAYLYTTYDDRSDKTSVRVKCRTCGACGPKVYVAGYHSTCDAQIEETDMHAMQLWQQRI